MNTSHFMDKQIMDLSSSSAPSSFSPPQTNDKDFIDLGDDHHQKHDNDDGFDSNKEGILPNYDFQPINRPPASNSNLSASANTNSSSAAAARVWCSSDSKPNSTSPIRNYGSLDSLEPAKFILEKDRNVPDTPMLSEIDQTMKKHADNLLRVLEGVSARLTQLETRTCNLENSVDDLKVCVANNHGSTDGKMRQLENILREVQTGVQELKDKQEIVQAQLHLSKLQVSKVDQQPETQNASFIGSTQPPASPPQHQHQLPPPVSFPQPVPPIPPHSSTAPPPAVPQLNPPVPPVQHPTQFPSVPQQEPYFPPPGQSQIQPPPNQSYQVPPPPPTQPPQPAPAGPPHQPPYQTPQSQYSQPPPAQLPQLPTASSYHPEEPPFPPQNYPPSQRQPLSQPPSGSAPSQQYFGAPPPVYEQPSGRSSSGFPTGYAPQPGTSEPYPYGGPPSQFGSNTKPPHMSSGTGYPQLPTARPLPHAIPTASAVSSGGSNSPRSGNNRLPIDDVVDKVTSMGFPREQVRATVRKLTENGQAVDLNVVLDKLMNEGGMQQQTPPRGWFGGR